MYRIATVEQLLQAQLVSSPISADTLEDFGTTVVYKPTEMLAISKQVSILLWSLHKSNLRPQFKVKALCNITGGVYFAANAILSACIYRC